MSSRFVEMLEGRRLLSAQYRVTLVDDLLPTPFVSAQPSQINNLGRIGGTAFTLGGASQRAFVISKSKVTILGKLGGNFSTGQGMNMFAQVVGGSPPSTVQGEHAVIYNGSATPTDLGTLGGGTSVATAVNDRGIVVGQSRAAGAGLTTTQHAFAFENGSMVDIGDANQSSTDAVDVNLNNVVAVNGSTRSYLFDLNGSARHDLPVGFAPFSLNDRGLVAGQTPRGDGVHHDAAVFNSSTSIVTDIGSLGGGTSDSQANDVNNADVAVGASGTQGGSSASHAFIWTAGRGLRDLNGLIDSNSGWLLSSASSVNDQGAIVGTGIFNGRVHGFLLTPLTPTDIVPPGTFFFHPKQPAGEPRSAFTFSIEYTDDNAVDVGTIDASDVYVVDPNGAVLANVKLLAVSRGKSAASITASYQVSGITQGGDYTVHVKRRAVADVNGNFVPGKVAGFFHVKHFV